MDGDSGVDRREGGHERSEVGGAAPLLSGGGGSSVVLTPSAARLIPLRTQDDTRRFLRAIVEKFVEVVDMEVSGLLDALVAAGVITERDEESLDGTHLPTRSERARHLWTILYHVQHVTFVTQVLPHLCRHYWYIIPQAFWLPGDAPVDPGGLQHHQSLEETGNCGGPSRCVRCAIQGRIRPTDLGDLLMTAGLITERTYRNISNSYRSSNTNWSEIFGAFKKLAGSDVSSHVAKMRRLMANHSLPVPDNLQRLMTQGFPCSCSSRRRPGLCIPDCLADRSSGSESSPPAAPSLSVDGYRRHPRLSGRPVQRQRVQPSCSTQSVCRWVPSASQTVWQTGPAAASPAFLQHPVCLSMGTVGIPDCLADRSSGSESSLPAAPSLSVDGYRRHPRLSGRPVQRQRVQPSCSTQSVCRWVPSAFQTLWQTGPAAASPAFLQHPVCLSMGTVGILDCLADRSSGSESSLPAAPSLSVDGYRRHPSELSLPSASSHGAESGGWDSHRLSDHYSETSLKEVVSISAQNHPHSAGDSNDEASQSGGSHVSRDRSETSLKEVVSVSAQSNSLSTADSDDGASQGGGGSHTSSDHGDTALKRAVSVTAVSRSWPTVRAAGSSDPQDSLQPAGQKTGLEFAEEAEPPPYSRYAESDGRVSQLADQEEYTETQRIHYNEEVPNDKTKCAPNTDEEPSVSDTRRKDRAQFHTPTVNQGERSRQTSIPEQRRWTIPPSQGPTISSYSSHPSGGEMVNDGLADTTQELAAAAFLTEENCNFCATTMPWTHPEHMKSDSSFTVSNGTDVVGLLIFCALILAPVVLLFYGVYSQNYAFHVAGTALIILLMCLAVLIRSMHK